MRNSKAFIYSFDAGNEKKKQQPQHMIQKMQKKNLLQKFSCTYFFVNLFFAPKNIFCDLQEVSPCLHIVRYFEVIKLGWTLNKKKIHFALQKSYFLFSSFERYVKKKEANKSIIPNTTRLHFSRYFTYTPAELSQIPNLRPSKRFYLLPFFMIKNIRKFFFFYVILPFFLT